MQIQVKWENGALYPVEPLRLKHKTVVVEIADDELQSRSDLDDLPEDILVSARHLQERFEAIRNAMSIPEADAPELTKKQLQRMEANTLREELRKELGHTA